VWRHGLPPCGNGGEYGQALLGIETRPVGDFVEGTLATDA